MSNQQFMPTINLSPLFERKSDAWAAVDLTVFGLALGQSTNSVTLNLVDNQFFGSSDPMEVVALNTSVVPVPAAVWLFGSLLV